MVLINVGVLLVLFGVSATIRAETGFGEVVHDWPRGFTGRLNVTMDEDVEEGWTMSLTFSSPLKRLDIWRAEVVSQSDDGKVFEVENKPWNTQLRKGSTLRMRFNGYKRRSGTAAPEVSVEFRRKSEESGSGSGDLF